MKCNKAKLVSPYMDDRLTHKEQVGFEAHLRDCSFCRTRLRAFQNIKAGFARSERKTAPAWFSTRVMAKVVVSRPERFSLFPAIVRFGEVLVVLMMIIVGVASGRFLVNGMEKNTISNLSASLSLDVFDAAPSNSVGGVYLALTEANNGK